MKCGREPGGRNERELGTCPSATEKKLDGVHLGRNAGRSFWAVAGTLCGGQVRGTFAMKMAKCESCEFFALVKEEEKENFESLIKIANKLASGGENDRGAARRT